MMSMACGRGALEVFSKYTSHLPRNLPVAVAVSGGCDSLALTALTAKVFDRVVGLVVDHKLRDASTEEAAQANCLVTELGAQAHTLTLDWGVEGLPEPGKVQTRARQKRYSALLEQCQVWGIKTLLVGHHLGDQYENFLHRFAMGSGIEGLGGMYSISAWPGYPNTKIVRPLLTLKKCDLVEVCRREGLDWVEDPTNKTTDYVRNHYRNVLEENPVILDGVKQLTKSCYDTRAVISKQVHSHVISLTNINTKYGYIGVDRAKLLSVTPPIAKRSLAALIRSVMCSPEYQFRYAVLEKSYKTLMSYDGKPFSVGKAVVAPITDRTIGIYKSLNHDDSLKSKTPIRPGETILWENRWEIQLKPKTTNSQLQEQYFVRNMGRKEYEFATRGIRRIRSTPLPPVSARSSLPVITDAAGRVLLIPHFQFAERNVTISARVSFEPKYSVEDVLLNH